VPVVTWGLRGPEVSVNGIAELLAGRPTTNAVLLANHGLLAFGPDLLAAARLVIAIEEAAGAELAAAAIGGAADFPAGAPVAVRGVHGEGPVMTGADDRDSAQAVRDRYRAMFGEVPTGIEQRLRVAQSTGRLPAVEVIEELRQALPPTTPWVLGCSSWCTSGSCSPWGAAGRLERGRPRRRRGDRAGHRRHARLQPRDRGHRRAH
jgi:hypothetical protein